MYKYKGGKHDRSVLVLFVALIFTERYVFHDFSSHVTENGFVSYVVHEKVRVKEMNEINNSV